MRKSPAVLLSNLRPFISVCALSATLMATSDSGAQPRYQLRELTAPGVGSTAMALNDAEQVAGSYTVADVGPFFTYYYAHACIWQPDGGRTDLGVLEWHVAPGVPTRYYSDHIAADINNAGEVVGAGTWSSGGNINGPPERAFLWMPAEGMRPLPAFGPPNTSRSRANGISNTHRIVGSASPGADLDANGSVIRTYPMVPAMWTTGGDITALGTLPGTFGGDAVAISRNGRFVVGWFDNGVGPLGFLWEEGVGMRAIPELAGCAFLDVNDEGVIVGNCGPAAFTWSEASGVWFIPLLAGYGGANYASAINNTGQVVGWNGGVPIWGPIDVGLLAQAGGGGVVSLQSLACGTDLYIRFPNAINSRGAFTGRGLTSFSILGTPIPAPTAEVNPVTASACPAGAAAVSVSAMGVGSFDYQWQLQTAPDTWVDLGDDPGALPCGGTAFATPLNAPAVTIGIRPCPESASAPQHFQVRCLVTNACGSVTSNEATYTICPADINCSGTMSVQDIFDFLAAYFSSQPSADFNQSGAISVQDIFDFLAAYFAGCP